MKLDWSSVQRNSSSVDAVLDFARGSSLRRSRSLVWDPDTLRLFSGLARLPVATARQRARGWARRNTYSL